MKALNLSLIVMPVIMASMMSFSSNRNNVILDKNDPKEIKKNISSYPKPTKKYTKVVIVAVKDAMKTITMFDNESGLNSSIKSEVRKLSIYSKDGLDLDLIMYHVNKISKEKNLNAEQTEKLLDEAANTWNVRMKVSMEKGTITQLQKEVNSNLKVALELKQNTDHILSSLQMISSEQVLRNPKIKILPVLFPIENINSVKPISELAETSLIKYKTSGLINNKAEIDKFASAGNAISLTIKGMLSTISVLSDYGDTKYFFSTAVLNANNVKLGSVGVFDMDKISQTYTGLNISVIDYNEMVTHAMDYLNNLNTFFKSGINSISKENVQSFLISERQAYEIIAMQQKLLSANIEDLTKIQRSIDETLR